MGRLIHCIEQRTNGVFTGYDRLIGHRWLFSSPGPPHLLQANESGTTSSNRLLPTVALLKFADPAPDTRDVRFTHLPGTGTYLSADFGAVKTSVGRCQGEDQCQKRDENGCRNHISFGWMEEMKLSMGSGLGADKIGEWAPLDFALLL